MLILQKKESTPDAATQRLSSSERIWINSRERRRRKTLAVGSCHLATLSCVSQRRFSDNRVASVIARPSARRRFGGRVRCAPFAVQAPRLPKSLLPFFPL